MQNALIICTYMRPKALQTLLDSILALTVIPQQIIIVDGSVNIETKIAIECSTLYQRLNLHYYLVEKENRGLTRQRNFGVSQVHSEIKLISFLDDDLVLDPRYFEEVQKVFLENSDVIGVGGIDLKENKYFRKEENKSYNSFQYYELDGWMRKEPLRYKARKFFGLMTSLRPDIIPSYSHGRSGYPPNGQLYDVEHFMGGIATYRKELFTKISFSRFFEGYGLYEDFDFCVRALPYGKLIINTNAKVWHYHEPFGRPNLYNFGKMVVRNGWYVWRIRFSNPTFSARLKWNATSFLLAQIRLLNAITGPKRKPSFQEYLGRTAGWFALIFNKPKILK